MGSSACRPSAFKRRQNAKTRKRTDFAIPPCEVCNTEGPESADCPWRGSVCSLCALWAVCALCVAYLPGGLFEGGSSSGGAGGRGRPYLRKLLAEGHRVAICEPSGAEVEQSEPPATEEKPKRPRRGKKLAVVPASDEAVG
jgi:hypothetical protein